MLVGRVFPAWMVRRDRRARVPRHRAPARRARARGRHGRARPRQAEDVGPGRGRRRSAGSQPRARSTTTWPGGRCSSRSSSPGSPVSTTPAAPPACFVASSLRSFTPGRHPGSPRALAPRAAAGRRSRSATRSGRRWTSSRASSPTGTRRPRRRSSSTSRTARSSASAASSCRAPSTMPTSSARWSPPGYRGQKIGTRAARRIGGGRVEQGRTLRRRLGRAPERLRPHAARASGFHARGAAKAVFRLAPEEHRPWPKGPTGSRSAGGRRRPRAGVGPLPLDLPGGRLPGRRAGGKAWRRAPSTSPSGTARRWRFSTSTPVTAGSTSSASSRRSGRRESAGTSSRASLEDYWAEPPRRVARPLRRRRQRAGAPAVPPPGLRALARAPVVRALVMRTYVRGGSGHHPPRRPGRVLRVGRAAGRPAPARATGDRRRGVVLAASYEAKARGVRTAMGGRRALRLCPDAVVVPPRMEAYSEASKAVFRVFEDTTPLVEGLSIDEAFLDTRGMERLAGQPGRDRRPAPPRGQGAGRPADHRRGGADEVPRQGRERRGEARRPAPRPARPRARLPPPAPGRAALGRRPGDGRSAAPARDHDRRAGRGVPGDALLTTIVGRAAGRHLHALAHNRDPRPVERRRRAALDRLAAGSRPPLAGGARRRPRRPGRPGDAADADGRQRRPDGRPPPALRRLLPRDPLPDHGAADRRDPDDPGRVRELVAAAAPAIRRQRPDARRASPSRISTTSGRSSSSCPFWEPGWHAPWTPRSTRCGTLRHRRGQARRPARARAGDHHAAPPRLRNSLLLVGLRLGGDGLLDARAPPGAARVRAARRAGAPGPARAPRAPRGSAPASSSAHRREH